MLDKRNNALSLNGNTVNGRTADIGITTHGSDWFWAVFSVMSFSTIAFLGLGLTKPRSHRAFHYITAAITLVAAIAYFSMASNLGFTPIAVEFQRSNPRVSGQYREIFYVRYIDWFITTPLLLLDLLLTAGVPWQTILWVILVDWVMIVTGLVGALVESSYKWGYFVFGCVALFYIVYQLAWESRLNARRLGDDVGRVFLTCGSLTLFLWILYPIAWGICEGGNVIAPDSEAVFYGVLDVLAKPVFGALLLFGHRNIDPARLGVLIRDYEADTVVHTHAEKQSNGEHVGAAAPAPAPVVADGATTTV
jgi:bacteriorhodopsin